MEKSFLEEVNRNMGIVHKVVNIYYASGEDREDARQEILFQLWKSYDSFKSEAKFSTWMYKVALNTAITFVKKNYKHAAEIPDASHVADAIDHHEQLVAKEKIDHLYAAINALGYMDKAIAFLYLEDKSYEEMAAITGLSKSNISVRLVRIRITLKKKLENIFQ